MQSKRKVFEKPTKSAIPGNRIQQAELPPAVRDLADLLAELAGRRLRKHAISPQGAKNNHE